MIDARYSLMAAETMQALGAAVSVRLSRIWGMVWMLVSPVA